LHDLAAKSPDRLVALVHPGACGEASFKALPDHEVAEVTGEASDNPGPHLRRTLL